MDGAAAEEMGANEGNEPANASVGRGLGALFQPENGMTIQAFARAQRQIEDAFSKSLATTLPNASRSVTISTFNPSNSIGSDDRSLHGKLLAFVRSIGGRPSSAGYPGRSSTLFHPPKTTEGSPS